MTADDDEPRGTAWYLRRALEAAPPEPRSAGLVALAMRLAVELDRAALPEDVARLAGQLRPVMVELGMGRPAVGRPADDETRGGEGAGSVDELRSRRRTRADRAAAVDPPAR